MYYHENGQLTTGASSESLVYNWDGKLRSATKGTKSVSLKYDPSGNRIKKTSSVSGTRKYIVDIVGELPVILLVLDNSQNVLNRYIYSNSQIVAQHDVDDNNKLYFYLNDRLGSVRQVMDTSGNIVRLYTYEPFGTTLENEGTFDNAFMFTGQWFDSEIDWYYLRARPYVPYIGRFPTRDPVNGKFIEPLTLHKYLYCLNDPVTQPLRGREIVTVVPLPGLLVMLSLPLFNCISRAA